MSETTKNILAVLGGIVSILGLPSTIVSFFYGNPDVTFALLLVTCLAFEIFVLAIVLKKNDNNQYVHNVRARWIAPVVVLAILIFMFSQVAPDILKLADIYSGPWLREGNVPVANQSHPYAYTTSNPTADDVLSTMGCGLVFHAQARNRFHTPSVDAIKILVLNHTPFASATQTQLYGGSQESNAYYAEIGPITNALFPAAFVRQEPGTLRLLTDPLVKVTLEKDKPEKFFVKVNAKVPGIYRLRCLAELVSGSKKHIVQIGEDQDFVFLDRQ